MKKLLCCAVVLACLAGLSGCMRAPVMPPMGAAFSQIKAPLDHDYDPTNAKAAKNGWSESTSILGLVALGDASTQAAAERGGLSTIDYADYEYYNVLGVYQRYRTVVYGN